MSCHNEQGRFGDFLINRIIFMMLDEMMIHDEMFVVTFANGV
jgi:hypothetical protein